jgi:DNA-binding transcriptional MerR regulator
VTERSYLSIGDVLSLLREEFPDITISKIRFLESRGLLIPERTPSGYRKFYDHDVDRLRWILRQQRENFLPLKVIKGRLEGQEPSSEPTHLFEVGDPGDAEALQAVFVRQPANGSRKAMDETAAHASALSSGRTSRNPATAVPTPRVTTGQGAITPRPSSEHPSRQHTTPVAAASDDERVASVNGAEVTTTAAAGAVATPAVTQAAAGGSEGLSAGVEGVRPGGPDGTGGHVGARPDVSRAPSARSHSDVRASGGPPPSAEVRRPAPEQAGSSKAAASASEASHRGGLGASASGTRAGTGSEGDPVSPHPSDARHDTGELAGASLTVGELAQASGLEVHQVEELESYSLIESRMVAGVLCYDEEALLVANLAAGFARFGVEARHLRMFKHAAERQAGLYSQIVMPLLRQRNPDARRRAHEDLTRLTDLGASMQACFAKAMLRDLTRG